ncbi:MAG: ribonuclease Z [Acidobacteria bacterium]|nr:ribonuclease Z [Acidobacteriota bacterium]
MQLTVLGSGTAVPHPKRASSAYWLQTSEATVLLDLSVFALGKLLAEGFEWHNLDAIWISHFHLDHIGGLPAFLFGTRHAEEMQGRKKPLQIFGGPGLKQLLKGFSGLSDYKLLDQPFPLDIVEVEPLEKFEIAPGIEAVALKTPHTEESLAVHLRDRDSSTLVYTSDTGFTETLAAFARRVDLLIIEASFPFDNPTENHLELAQAMYVIRKAEPTLAVLTHLYPYWDDIDFDSEVAKFAPQCEVVQAFDGLKLVLPSKTRN